MTASAETATATGRVARVTGAVVDVEFSVEAMPEIYNALKIEVTRGGETRTVNLETAQHIGDNMVRAISLQPTDGIVRGAPVFDTGAPISVPVGDVVKGHVFNTIGSRARPRSSRPASRSSTCSPRTSRAARSACSAGRVWARRSSSRR
jgi:F-type H+-transporting ATPase subunit beta